MTALQHDIADTYADICQYAAMLPTDEWKAVDDDPDPYPFRPDTISSGGRGNTSSSRVESLALKRISGIAHMKRWHKKMVDVQAAIDFVLEYANDRERNLLQWKYLDKITVSMLTIADRLDTTLRQVLYIDEVLVDEIIKNYNIRATKKS
jgi:hypothetical protein